VTTSVLAISAVLIPATAVSGAVATSTSAGTRLQTRGLSSQDSTNWSGYEETGGKYTEVTGYWTVPAAGKTTIATYSCTWVGIGETKHFLVQVGTESDYHDGAPHYYAWWEMLPANQSRIPTRIIKVSPGDHIVADVAGSNPPVVWEIQIADRTTGQSYEWYQDYGTGAPGSAVEWIQEATTIGAKIATLAHYGEVTFTGLSANWLNPKLKASDEVFLATKPGTIISTPSAPSPKGDAFSVKYGSKAPRAPTG
jgi:hypothetical protein